jgi:hypothetical protein
MIYYDEDIHTGEFTCYENNLHVSRNTLTRQCLTWSDRHADVQHFNPNESIKGTGSYTLI